MSFGPNMDTDTNQRRADIKQARQKLHCMDWTRIPGTPLLDLTT